MFPHLKVMIRAWHFSLYTAIVSCPYPDVRQPVCVHNDTVVHVSDVKGVQLSFPKESSTSDFEARIKVFYADDPNMPQSDIDNDRDDGNALATPVVMLGPHGITFDKDVLVQLPIPDCGEIMRKFDKDPRHSLTIYHSPTGEDEPIAWQSCEVDYQIKQEEDGSYAVVFPVRHFSWYKAVWDILSSTVHGAKVGVSYFYPYIRFAMMCSAMMDETSDTRSFGLEVSL